MPLIVTPSKLNQQSELYHQLGSMLSAGIPLANALEMVKSNPPHRSFIQPVGQLLVLLQQGLTFSQAMSQVSGWLPLFDMALLTAGEQSGRLDACFKLLATYYHARAKILRDLIGDLTYTVLTLHVFILIFPLSYLVAIFTRGAVVPFLLQKVLVFGLLYGVVFLAIYACQGKHGEKWRGQIEAMARMIPILGTARQYLSLSRLSAALEALINAGVSIVSAWELSAAASGSPALLRTVTSWKPYLERGDTPAEMVNNSNLFPQLFSNLYQTGEVSGQQDTTLQRLQSYYQEEGFRKLKLFTRVFNGILYAILVLMVVLQVFGFYLGYYGGVVNTGF